MKAILESQGHASDAATSVRAPLGAGTAAAVDRVVRSRAGTPLVYRIYGTRGPFLCGCNGVGVSTVFFTPFARKLSNDHRVILWDYPGHGRSGDPEAPAEVSIRSLADDLETVLDAAGAEKAVILGHSLGAQVSLEFYRRHPRRVLGLVPTHGTSGRAVESFFNFPSLAVPIAALAERILPAGHRAVPPLLEALAVRRSAETARRPRVALLERAARALGIVSRDAPDLGEYFVHLTRIDLRVFAALIGDAQRHDAGDLLARVDVPVLVVGADRDLFVPLRVVRELARRVPKAELFVLPNATHAGLFEQAELYAARVRRFLHERVEIDFRGQPL